MFVAPLLLMLTLVAPITAWDEPQGNCTSSPDAYPRGTNNRMGRAAREWSCGGSALLQSKFHRDSVEATQVEDHADTNNSEAFHARLIALARETMGKHSEDLDAHPTSNASDHSQHDVALGELQQSSETQHKMCPDASINKIGCWFKTPICSAPGAVQWKYLGSYQQGVPKALCKTLETTLNNNFCGGQQLNHVVWVAGVLYGIGVCSWNQ
eukprot:TRINITY_DN1347_c0_g1_i1.p1 TRINITY_DN1347_c0_g1~~TRINITY_DN1347_c0_g1_i1.p1  ORF type:complete len:211 (-),score=25.88 TRINITY_DN1347_c0_g1_i1:97-729(-)